MALESGIVGGPGTHSDGRMLDFETTKLVPCEELEDEANLYSILLTTEHLERAYVNGRLQPEDYERECTALIGYFKMVRKALQGKVADIEEFAQKYGLRCPLAIDRLLHSGVPATQIYGNKDLRRRNDKQPLLAFELSESFITLLDAIKLREHKVTTLQPLVKDIVQFITQFSALPQAEELDKMRQWHSTLSKLDASDSLTLPQTRQLGLDTENAYNAFRRWLQFSG